MEVRSTAPHGMMGDLADAGTCRRRRASIPAVARCGRASAGVLTLVVMTTAACGADEPAAPPPTSTPPPSGADGADDAPGPSLARRIAPLIELPSTPPPPPPPPRIAEDIPSTGIETCDDYLRGYILCLESTMPAEAIEPVRKALAEAARSFAQMAETADADIVRETCRSAEESARSAMKGLGCVWE